MKQLVHLYYFVGLALGAAWQDGVEIKSHLKRDELERHGTFSGHPEDHLSILKWTDGNIFVGGRNTLYNLDSRNLQQISKLDWTVSTEHKDMCQIKGQKESLCHNFIKVLHGPLRHHHHSGPHHAAQTQLKNGGDENDTTPVAKALTSEQNDATAEDNREFYVICGTNAFKPQCRTYSLDFSNHSNDMSGVGYSPYDPTHKSTSVLHHGSIYSATVADFGGIDALIYKAPLRTEQNDLKHLNSPSFMSSTSYGDLALFFFKEFAIEHTNCGKAMFSRVGRICRHDFGSKKHKDRFTTFLKARLNCSVPGEFPFYFDHIQGTTDIFRNDANDGEDMLYAVFTTPENSLTASAVCGFTMKDILKVFAGPFKGQTTFNSNWLPVPESSVPNPRPGACNNDPTYSPDSNSIAFHKAHPLMDEVVQGTLMFPYTGNKDKFTCITVDSSKSIAPRHIIYIGTDSGKVLKAIVSGNHTMSSPPNLDQDQQQLNLNASTISQSWELFDEPIKSLVLINSRRLLVSTETQVTLISVDNCGRFRRCDQCLSLYDPHCVWWKEKELCVNRDSPELAENEDYTVYRDFGSGGNDINVCPADEYNNEIVAKANHLKSNLNSNKNQEDSKDGDECCSCSTTTTTVAPNKMSGSGEESSNGRDSIDNRIGSDQRQRNLQYLGNGRDNKISSQYNDQIIIAAENETLLNNEIPPSASDLDKLRKDYEASSVKSEDANVSSQSIILATLSSTILSLLVGFTLGFISSKWLAIRRNKLSDTASSASSTNAQLASLNESQRLTAKSIDFVVNVPSVNNKNSKLTNTDTLEKTVKKIYL